MNTGNNDYTNKTIKQKYLGNRGLLILTAFLSAFIPLSTDLYLPSLPLMTQSFHTTSTLVNLTIILFFAFFALGTLFWGPLSDKYGRRKILLTGLVMYTASSILCAVSGNIYQLIIFRVLQAVSSGASTAVGTAIVKDIYEGKKRESILAVVQSMAMVAPIIAPVIGALILKVTSWRGVFWVLAILGLIAAIGGTLLQETISERYKGSTFKSLGQLAVVIKNPGFSSLLVTFFLVNIPYMAFITASSYIYVEGFGLSEQVYSYFFAFNAFFALIGPLIYIRLSRHFRKY
jgi:DHA1 family bicyclomycin/chloramphenicol resistance-like MFS transporter